MGEQRGRVLNRDGREDIDKLASRKYNAIGGDI